MSRTISLHLRIWRQEDPETSSGFQTFRLEAVSTDLSLLEALDLLTEQQIMADDRPVTFEHDCREGSCGSCGFLVNGQADAPQTANSVCQLYLRQFIDGATLTLESWRVRAFPLIQDLAEDRSALDRMLASWGYRFSAHSWCRRPTPSSRAKSRRPPPAKPPPASAVAPA